MWDHHFARTFVNFKDFLEELQVFKDFRWGEVKFHDFLGLFRTPGIPGACRNPVENICQTEKQN